MPPARRCLLALLLGACTPTEAPRANPPADTPRANPSAEATPAPAPTPTASEPAAPGGAAAEASGSTPGGAGEIEIVARIVETGPIGDGRCVQRSYKIEIANTLRGSPLPSPSWVHFERCIGATTPPFNGGGLAVGASYRLVLTRGMKSNFGHEPMIVGAERQGAAGR